MKKLALLLSLLALGALGLVGCGGGDDDEATAASETETTVGSGEAVTEADAGNKNQPSDEEIITKKGNEWAALFAKADRATCDYYEHQPPCERERCRYISGDRIKNCKPLSSDFRKSFANATVERVFVAAPYATAEFSNGESVEFVGPRWHVTGRWIKKITRRNFARHTVTEQGVSFSFRVPVGQYTPGDEGWWERFSSITTDKSAGGPISINKSETGPQGAEAIIFWTSFPAGEYADPCARLLSPPVGSSAADLAAAVSTAPGTELLRGPSNVTLGGRPAKHVALTVRGRVGCEPGFFYTWKDVFGGALWPKTRVGDTIRVWIVAVHGTRLFIEAETAKQASRDFEQEVQQIVESIRFE